MAQDIANLCKEFAEGRAANYDDSPFEDAAHGLAKDIRRHAEEQGWSPKHYHIDIDRIARDALAG